MNIIQRLTDLNAQLVRGHWYGEYYIVFKYKGETHRIYFTESEVWDNYGDYDHPELDKEAKEWVYNRIQRFIRFIEEQML